MATQAIDATIFASTPVSYTHLSWRWVKCVTHVWLLKTEELVLKKYLEDKEEYMSTIKIKQVKIRIGSPADQKRKMCIRDRW